MALPSTGAISLQMIQNEFGGGHPISISEYYGADTGVPASGTIRFSDFWGKQNVVPGSQNYLTPGTYSFNCPKYNNLTVDVGGAGGGGSGSYSDGVSPIKVGPGTDGQNSVFYSSTNVIGYGGWAADSHGTHDGVDRPGSGGEQNITGGGGAGGKEGWEYGANGGNGGRAIKTWSKTEAGHPVDTSNYTVVVGRGGAGGGNRAIGGNGANGWVKISWN